MKSFQKSEKLDLSPFENFDQLALTDYFLNVKIPGGPLEWQEGVSGSSMDTQKAP